MSEQKELGRALIKSFVAVACGVLVATVGYMLIMGLIIVLFYPAHARQMAENPNKQTEAGKERQENAVQPKLDLPTSFFAICPAVQAITAWLGGYLAARLAPAARMGHGLLVAGVLLFNSIQLLLEDAPVLPGWLISINTIVGPACALWGATLAEKFAPLQKIYEESEQNVNDDDDNKS